jgi:hypothetical protein
MLFGLATAPAVFQKAITHTLFEFLGENDAVCLGDNLIATNNLEENFSLSTKIMEKLTINNFV